MRLIDYKNASNWNERSKAIFDDSYNIVYRFFAYFLKYKWKYRHYEDTIKDELDFALADYNEAMAIYHQLKMTHLIIIYIFMIKTIYIM